MTEKIDGYFIEKCPWKCGKKRWCYANSQVGPEVNTCVLIDPETMCDTSGRKYRVKETKVFAFCELTGGVIEDEDKKLDVVRESEPVSDENTEEASQPAEGQVESSGGEGVALFGDIEEGQEVKE